MSVDESQPELEPSRLPRSNSVEASDGRIQGSEESQVYEERVAERAAVCVEEFREKYPYLASLPLSEVPGQKLRVELVEMEWVKEHVAGDREWESGFTVDQLDRAESVTWADAMFRFLVSRQPYDDGLGGRFRSRIDGESFTVGFDDCWTSSYGDRQAARNAAFQRQLMGGVYPDSEESARAGEHVEGDWGDVATIMLTRTGTSVPGGDRIAPVDHADRVSRTWSKGGVYDRVRNAAEFKLGLDSDQWGYVRGDDVHGLDSDEPGENACYVHCHDAIYIDLEATGLCDEFGTDEEIEAVIESAFYPAIEKHVEVCELAKPEAHTRERAIDVRLDLEEPAGYATEYLRLQEGKPMMEMPVEMQSFAAVEWAQGRQRIARSKIFNRAADADLCLQDRDSAHGFRLKYDKHGEVVCASCGSSVGIDASSIAEYRLSTPEPSARPQAVADGGGSVVVGARVGESTGAARARALVEEHVATHGRPESIASLMGELGVDPSQRRVVVEAVEGCDSSVGAEPIYGEPAPPEAEYELVEILKPDGSTEPAGSGGGGVRMQELVLPEQRLLRETRLRYHGELGSPKIRCERTGVAMYSAESMAGYLVHKCNVREPWYAEVLLSFEARQQGVPEEFEEPVAHPPGDL